MAKLVEDLLILARLDEHTIVSEEPVELVGLAAEALETARMVGPKWPVEFKAEESVEVAGDRQALRRVFDNLLSNVRAHTPEGTAATLTVTRRGEMALLEFADEGRALVSQKRINSSNGSFVQTVLGRVRPGAPVLALAIVASIVGRVTAGLRPEAGAVFRLPVLPANGMESLDLDVAILRSS